MTDSSVRCVARWGLLFVFVLAPATGCMMIGMETASVEKPTVREPFRPPPDCLKLLAGSWTMHPANNESERQVWTFAGDTFRTQGGANGEFQEGTVSVNSQMRPVEIDIRIAAASDASLVGKTLLGIVRMRGDSAKFCIAEPQARNRPAYFDAAQGRVFVGTRQ